MAAVDSLLVSALLATSLVFAIIELGLSAYTISIATETTIVSTYDPNYAGLGYGGYDVFSTTSPSSAPGPINFLLFASLWTVLLIPAFFAILFLTNQKRAFWTNSTGQPVKWLAPVMLALNSATMVFWLAGFAALADMLGGGAPQGLAGALLAVAIMLWLIFLVLLVFNILLVTGISKSERMGHALKFKHHGFKSAPEAVLEIQHVENQVETGVLPKAPEAPVHEPTVIESS